LWAERLAFRDRLRSDPVVAREYAELKHRLSEAHRFDREAYTNAKGPFIARVLQSLLGDARETET
ncbi:MAG: GrpB family protein, partial [Vicinamibacteria bacterium]